MGEKVRVSEGLFDETFRNAGFARTGFPQKDDFKKIVVGLHQLFILRLYHRISIRFIINESKNDRIIMFFTSTCFDN